MHYLHTMLRVTSLEDSLKFFCDGLGLREVKRKESEKGRFTLVFLAAPGDDLEDEGERPAQPQLELTYNWDSREYQEGNHFGHIAFAVDNIYEACSHLQKLGVTINRPPRDGHMAFVRSPDNISIELLQKGASLPAQSPWSEMKNTGNW